HYLGIGSGLRACRRLWSGHGQRSREHRSSQPGRSRAGAVDVALIAAAAAAVLAGAVFQRLSGIGFSLVAAPALALISGPRSGVALTNLLAVVVALVVFATSGRRVDRSKALILIPAGLIGVLPGTVLFRLLSPGQLQVAVGTITALGLAAVLLAPR